MIQYPSIPKENFSSSSLNQTLDQVGEPNGEMVVLDNLDSSKESSHDKSSQDIGNTRRSSTFQRLISSIGTRHFILGFFALSDLWITISILCIMMFEVYLPEINNSSAILHYSLMIIHSIIILLLVYLSICALIRITFYHKDIFTILTYTAVVIMMVALSLRQDDDLKSLACPPKNNNYEITRIIQLIASETIKSSTLHKQIFCNKTLIDDTALLYVDLNGIDNKDDPFKKIDEMINSDLCPYGESLRSLELIYSVFTTITTIAIDFIMKLGPV